MTNASGIKALTIMLLCALVAIVAIEVSVLAGKASAPTAQRLTNATIVGLGLAWTAIIYFILRG